MAEYIDKKTAINRIASNYCINCEHSNGILCRACEHQDDMDIIDSIPAVDVQPIKHGYWEEVTDYVCWEEAPFYRCSVCGEEWYLVAGNPKENNMNYCSRCGARMDAKPDEPWQSE